ncbi:CRTAC1 family protein [Celeribacter halophilus]|uniref:ASPIC and UnbV n=1 Tax=Celeribacter halophilus TaxID=576117 RepID=A0A1I3P562_9RHOB|nr:CRTAC1 family protein [Celeribacter halophilus]PZX14763.1 VCBS repeat protein [Celeribacter halophilus]SFJ16705.1 ASPIC and UnbV [Celeribacter halophilus]
MPHRLLVFAFGLITATPLPLLAQTIPQFQNRSDALPPHVYGGGWEHFVGGGLAVFDCNSDGMPEIFAAGGENPAQLMLNRSFQGEALRFEAGEIMEITGVTGTYPLDIDSDGVTDLAVLRVGENLLLRGLGDCAFERANEAWGFDGGNRWTTAFAAGWEGDADRPTLFFGNYVNRDDPDGPFCNANELHRPVESGYAKTLLEPGFCTLSALISKGARGKQSLRLSNDRYSYIKDGYEQLYDLQDNRFLGAQDGWEPLSIWGKGIAERDVNGDAVPDVILTSMGDQLLRLGHEDGSYSPAPYETGTYAHRPHLGDDGRPSTGWAADWGDVDNDTRVDLFIAKGNVEQMPGSAAHDPNNLLQQKSDGTFREVSIAAGVASMAKSRGGHLVDLNGDGKLDLVVMNRESGMELYENVTRNVGQYLAVTLRQSGLNPRAVGATVELLTNRGLQRQEITVGGSHASGKSVPLHFGLANAETAQIRVVWPDGEESDWVKLTSFNRWVELAR